MIRYSMAKLKELYVSEIVRLYVVLVAIMPHHDPCFTLRFGNGMKEFMGTKLHCNISFHPQKDGQLERII
jgi:hypothetical protein